MSLLKYTSEGQGRAIVFLHGFCEQKTIWSDFVKGLSKEYRTLCLDLPGFGESELTEDIKNLSGYADKVYETLQALDIGKCLLVGHSMGGYVALAYAKKYASSLSGISLFHSTALADNADKKDNRDKTIEFVESNGAEVYIKHSFANLFASCNKKRMASTIQEVIEMCQVNISEEAVIRATNAMKYRSDMTDLLQTFSFPVQYIIGKDDLAVPLPQSLEQCHLPSDAHVMFLEAVGHMGMFEEPVKTRAGVKAFADYCFSV